MIIKGGSRSNGKFFAKHLTNDWDEKNGNTRAELKEIRGITGKTVDDFFRETAAVASGTQVKNYFYHASISPQRNEHLTPKQWTEAVDLLEKNLGLTGQPRFIMEHEKDGRTHAHVIWARVDPTTMRARADGLTYAIHERSARALEVRFGLERVKSVLTKGREGPRPERRPQDWEGFRAQKSGIDPMAMSIEVNELWRKSDNGKAFIAAVTERGYQIAQGDRRDYVLIDQSGQDHSLARRLHNVDAAGVRKHMVDVDRSALPTVAEARTEQREKFTREGFFDRDAAAQSFESGLSGVALEVQQDGTRKREAQRADLLGNRDPSKIEQVILGVLSEPLGLDPIQVDGWLDNRGLKIARATSDDIIQLAKEHTERTKSKGKETDPPRIKEGAMFAVTRNGRAFALNPIKVDFDNLEKRLALYAGQKVGSVADARANQVQGKADREEERQKRHDDHWSQKEFYGRDKGADSRARAEDRGQRGVTGLNGGAMAGNLVKAAGDLAILIADIFSGGVTESKFEMPHPGSRGEDMDRHERAIEALQDIRESVERGDPISRDAVKNLDPGSLHNFLSRGPEALGELMRRGEEERERRDRESRDR